MCDYGQCKQNRNSSAYVCIGVQCCAVINLKTKTIVFKSGHHEFVSVAFLNGYMLPVNVSNLFCSFF